MLAAGAGRRFGGAKLTTPWRGGVLLDGALGAAFAAPVWRVTVVSGADPQVPIAAQAWAAARGFEPRLRLIHAQAHEEGISASLRAGVGALAPDCQGVFIFLGDMPLVPKFLALQLARALAAGALAAAPSFRGRRGHPVLFSRALFHALGDSVGDEGARSALAGIGQGLSLIEVEDPGVLTDVDRASDLPCG